jgi:hypothetical protein
MNWDTWQHFRANWLVETIMSKFVPPVFDSLHQNSFLNNGMAELTRMNEEIKKAEALKEEDQKERISHSENSSEESIPKPCKMNFSITIIS